MTSETSALKPLQIHIRQGGYLGNHMYQYMLARTIEADVKRPVHISGYSMDAWELHAPAQEPDSVKCYTIKSNLFDYRGLISKINSGEIDTVIIRSLAMRMEYYRAPEFYKPMFIPDPQQIKDIPKLGAHQILIHVRGGDILTGIHPDHHPLPLCYYSYLIEKLGLEPVFMGQIQDDDYSRRLKEKFSGARFLPQQTVLQDFETMRRAVNVVMSASSYAWMATWLSDSAARIYCPVAGFLHPAQRPDIDVLPSDDPRYVFYQFPVWRFKADQRDYEQLFSDTITFRDVKPRRLSRFEAKIRSFLHFKYYGLLRRIDKILEKILGRTRAH